VGNKFSCHLVFKCLRIRQQKGATMVKKNRRTDRASSKSRSESIELVWDEPEGKVCPTNLSDLRNEKPL
jgi:hypothetical protein